MKKIFFPVIGAVLLPIVMQRVNPSIQAAGIILVAGFGLGIGAVINKILFKEKDSEK
jgi:hypothetical protein